MYVFNRIFSVDNERVPSLIYVENRTSSLYVAFWERDDNGEDLSGIFKGHKGLKGVLVREDEYPLSLFQTHPQFKDASVFGLPHNEGTIIYASVDPGKQTFTGFYGFLQSNNYYVSVIFPDTESTFDDIILTVPVIDPDTIISHNGVNISVKSVHYANLDKHKLPIMQYIFPEMSLSGPSTVAPNEWVSLELSVGEGPLQLGSLFSVNVSSDNGYVPKRYMTVEEGSSVSIKVSSLGLDSGDTITVYAGFSQYDKLCNHRITIQE